MQQKVSLQITASGGIRMLHSDKVDLRQFGKVDVSRASHVEFDHTYQEWVVTSAKTGQILWSERKRADALKWEAEYYSPTGKGWKELTEEKAG